VKVMSETIVQEGLEAKMRDGTVLKADVWRPAGGGKHPVLLIRLPYDKSQGEDLCYAHPSWYARQGYATVVQDVRGRWASGGEFTPFEHEGDDGEDTMAWLTSLPFSNGRIGMYGFSYPAHTQLQIAARKHEGLRCMVPAMTSPDLYEGWAYNNNISIYDYYDRRIRRMLGQDLDEGVIPWITGPSRGVIDASNRNGTQWLNMTQGGYPAASHLYQVTTTSGQSTIDGYPAATPRVEMFLISENPAGLKVS